MMREASAGDLFAGLDAGGTKTDLLARTSDGAPDIQLRGPGANLLRAGTDTAARVLSALLRRALEERPGAALRSVFAGVAGAGDPAMRSALANALRAKMRDCGPFALRLVHDGFLALEAAFGGGSGLIVIAGTGSIVFARTLSGTTVRAGGWGHLIGDQGSGHALGLRGLRAAASALDGGPSTEILRIVRCELGASDRQSLLRAVYRERTSFQHLAEPLLKAAGAGDAVALRIVREEVRLLARQAAVLVGTSEGIRPQAALFGGLSRSDVWRECMLTALGEQLPGFAVSDSPHSALEAAVRLASACEATGSDDPR